MDYKQLAELNRGRRICQICLVTGREINDVLKEWVEKLQIGPWKVICFTNEVVRNGVMEGRPIDHPFKYYCAVTMVGDMQIEILKPIYGMPVLERFLAGGGDNLQHFKLFVPDAEAEGFLGRMASFGVPITYAGQFFNDYYCNFGTRDTLGFDLEIGNAADVDVPKKYVYEYPPQDLEEI